MNSSTRIATLAIVCLAALFPACNRNPSSAQDPVSAANAFFATLEKGEARAAYDSAAFGFQAAQTFDGFLSNARDQGIVGGQPPIWTSTEVQGAEARLQGAFISHAGRPVRLTVTMAPDGNTWKLFTLKTAFGDEDAQNHFTLVGAGTGFNDVYHQPMPDPARVDALVHQTIARLNTAIKTNSFHAFYIPISEQWKNGERYTGQRASGVTEKMLKDHFQGFIDKKIDLSPVAAIAPVYDDPPQINEDGLLEVHGHFDTAAYRVNFFLEYAYELPWWKLFGLDVFLTK